MTDPNNSMDLATWLRQQGRVPVLRAPLAASGVTQWCCHDHAASATSAGAVCPLVVGDGRSWRGVHSGPVVLPVPVLRMMR